LNVVDLLIFQFLMSFLTLVCFAALLCLHSLITFLLLHAAWSLRWKWVVTIIIWFIQKSIHCVGIGVDNTKAKTVVEGRSDLIFTTTCARACWIFLFVKNILTMSVCHHITITTTSTHIFSNLFLYVHLCKLDPKLIAKQLQRLFLLLL
jgi:hypothetical protein